MALWKVRPHKRGTTMSKNTGNIISLKDAKPHTELHLKDIPFDELVDSVRDELVNVLREVMPHNYNADDIEILTKVFKEIFVTDLPTD